MGRTIINSLEGGSVNFTGNIINGEGNVIIRNGIVSAEGQEPTDDELYGYQDDQVLVARLVREIGDADNMSELSGLAMDLHIAALRVDTLGKIYRIETNEYRAYEQVTSEDIGSGHFEIHQGLNRRKPCYIGLPPVFREVDGEFFLEVKGTLSNDGYMPKPKNRR